MPLTSQLPWQKKNVDMKTVKVAVIKNKPLEIKDDRALTLNARVEKLYKKTHKKLHTFVRATPNMSITRYDLIRWVHVLQKDVIQCLTF